MVSALIDLLRDRGVRYYFLHKAAIVVALPLTAVLVFTTLTNVAQGFFFTMLSLMALHAIAELGFNAGLIHFASHESSELRFIGGHVEGPARARSRLGSLVVFAAAWTAVTVLLFVPVLAVGGFAFLSASRDAAAVEWRGPWWLLCLTLPLAMCGATLRSLAEGCGDVSASQRSLLWSVIAGNVAIWAVLLGGGGLYAAAIGQMVVGIVTLALIVPHVRPQLGLVRERALGMVIDWRQEFWPHQWRLGISWLCGFAMFQTFVPFVFHSRGAEEAGQAGILLQAFSLANLLGLAWVTANQAKLGRAWAQHDYAALRTMARQLKWRAWWTAGISGVAAIAGVALLQYLFPDQALRIGPLLALAVLMACAVIMQSANVDTAVVRFRKTEPFLRNSIVGAIAVTASNWWLAPLGLVWLFTGFTAVMALIVVPWVHAIRTRQLAEPFHLPLAS